MSAREEILNRLKRARYTAPAVASWSYKSHSEDLAAQFGQALEAAKGEVFTAGNLASAWEILGEVLSDLGVKHVVVNHEPPLQIEDLQSIFPQYRWKEARGEESEIRQICLDADVGLTGAKFTLAETGSIGVASGADHSRMVSLIPPVHIVLLSEKVLVPDLISWEQFRPKMMPSQIVFISGPSKTADIEQTLVVGAHGPKRLIVIVYGES